MTISYKKIKMALFFALLFFSAVPYLFYAISALKANNQMIGSIYNSIEVLNISGTGTYFVYIKDVIAVFLLLLQIPSLRKNDLIAILVILAYGISVLLINGRFDFRYIISGFRASIFVLVTYLQFRKYQFSENDVKKIFTIIEITAIVHVIITVLQITRNANWATFGGGAYRYSSAFAGSGNLGCYSIAAILLIYYVFNQYSFLSYKRIIVNSLFHFFLSLASGTRTAIFIVGVIFMYIIVEMLTKRKKKKISKKFVYTLFILVFVIAIPFFYTWTVSRIDRGVLGVSGFGRITILTKIINGTSFELIFGRGIGYGTNASINIGLYDTFVSDSTFNLVLCQFGIIGLICFLVYYIKQFSRMIKRITDKTSSIMLILVFGVLCVVGNLFEQISMAEIYMIVFMLNLQLVSLNG